jgi:hypothetical protein
MSNTTMPDLPGLLWFILTVVTGGFVMLFWRMFKGTMDSVAHLTTEIQALRQEITQLREDRNLLPLMYRTKEEANHDWQELTKTLTLIQRDLQNLQKSHEVSVSQLWNKLNRMVDSFLFLAKLIIDRQQGLEAKIYCDKKEELKISQAETANLLAKLEMIKKENADGF